MKTLLVVVLGWCSVGCANYVTPAGGVSLAQINDYKIEEAYAREPAANFPANLVAVRVQATAHHAQSSFAVITRRDIETDQDLEALAELPAVRSLATLTRILLPQTLNNVRDLRISAAQLKADMLLLYTLDTGFRTDVGRIGPLQAVSLGFFPNRKSHVDASASILLVDVRTGYLYGTAEASATQSQRSDFWGSEAAIEKARFTAERAAFLAVVKKAEVLLSSVASEYAGANGY